MSAPEPRWILRDRDDQLSRVLLAAQQLLLEYPAAAQAAFRVLVAEGRAFAETPEGAAWKERLRDSELIRRGRIVFEVATLNLLEEQPESILPSQFLDALMMSTAIGDLEPRLARLLERERSDPDA